MGTDSWRFEVEAIVDPQSLLRVLGYFAQRSVLPDALEMRVGDGRMTISLIASDLPRAHADIIAAKLEQIMLVEAVTLHDVTFCDNRQAAA